MERVCEPQHDLFSDDLDGRGDVHLALRKGPFRLSRRTTEELVESPVRHGKAGAVVEVLHVETKGTVRLKVEQLIEDQVGILWLAVGCEAHELVLTGVDPEAREVRKRRVEQPQRVREIDFPEWLEVRAVAEPRRRCRPFTDAVETEYGRALERAEEKRRGCV